VLKHLLSSRQRGWPDSRRIEALRDDLLSSDQLANPILRVFRSAGIQEPSLAVRGGSTDQVSEAPAEGSGDALNQHDVSVGVDEHPGSLMWGPKVLGWTMLTATSRAD
jgi:hypothetical protein